MGLPSLEMPPLRTAMLPHHVATNMIGTKIVPPDIGPAKQLQIPNPNILIALLRTRIVLIDMQAFALSAAQLFV